MRQRQSRGARPHSFAEDGVEPEVLERGVQRFLDDAVEPVDLVDEEDVPRGQVEQDRAERTLVVDGRRRADLDGHPQLVRDDVRQRRLAQARRTAEQDMLDGLAAAPSGFEQDAQVVLHLDLPDVVRQHLWPQREVVLVVIGPRVQHLVYGTHFLPIALSASASASWVAGDNFQSTASNPALASWEVNPRLRRADSTARGTAPSPAIAAARGTTSRSAAASSFGLRSMITLAAVRWPTPLARRIGAGRSAMLARLSTSRLAALRMLSPTLGPTPSTPISISKSSSSCTEAKP